MSSSTSGVAEELHEATETTLPAFQSMVAATVEKRLIFTMRALASMHVLLSQKAEGTTKTRCAKPDSMGVWLVALKGQRAARPEVKHVWLDWLCMLHGDNTQSFIRYAAAPVGHLGGNVAPEHLLEPVQQRMGSM